MTQIELRRGLHQLGGASRRLDGSACLRLAAAATLVAWDASLGREFAEGPQALWTPLPCRSAPLDIVGVDVTPHVYSKELRYWSAPSRELGALVRIVVVNRDSTKALALRFRFNGKTPQELLDSGDWSWCETPENKPSAGDAYRLGPGKTDVFTFNGARPPWSAGNSFKLAVLDQERGLADEASVPIAPPGLAAAQIAFLGDDARSPNASRAVVHLDNRSSSPLIVQSVQLYTPGDDGMSGSVAATRLDPFAPNGALPPNDRGGVVAHFDGVPLARGLVRVDVQDVDRRRWTIWAPRFFGKQQFDVGSGWLDVPTEKGVVPPTRETYLKLLKRMHVNLAHIESIPGYTDSLGENGLYTRYPLRMMGEFADVQKYNADEWAARIHGVDCVGEAQMDKTPMQVHEAMKRYAGARYPTTMTFSEDKGFRYYAGLADFPHFDAYRVNCGSADEWLFYSRWGGRRLLWGAPLEGIGEMTRTLYALSRPAPIAAWSQNTHEGWYGRSKRKRESPTPDEIWIQAYEAIANGAKSLYWYSLQSWSLLKDRDVINVTTRVGREIRALQDLYLSGDAYGHQRVGPAQSPSLDLSSVVAPAHAVLFAVDLEYKPDFARKVFVFTGPRTISAEFRLPGYLKKPRDVFRIDADGVYDVSWKATQAGVAIQDELDRVGVYVTSRDESFRDALRARLRRLQEEERSVGFDPANDDGDYAALLRDFGYESADDIWPPKQ